MKKTFADKMFKLVEEMEKEIEVQRGKVQNESGRNQQIYLNNLEYISSKINALAHDATGLI